MKERGVHPDQKPKSLARSKVFPWLVASAGIPLILTLFTACSPDKYEEPKNTPALATEKYSPTEYSAEQKRLKEIINSLPETEIKTLLLKKVVPILDNPSGITTLDIAGIPIKIHGLEVTRKTQFTNETYGEFRPVGDPEKVESFFPVQEKTLQISYLYLLKPEEKKRLSPNIARDGTPFVNIIFPTTKPLHEGIAPVINVITIYPSIRKPEFQKLHKFLEDFTYIKEACGLLTYLLFLEDTAKKMQQLDFETHINSISTNGKYNNTEGINRSISILGSNYGRYVAAQDLTGYLFAVKAFGNNLNMDYIPESQRPFYEEMKNAPIGNNTSKILEESFQWIISLNPSQIPVHYVGDLNKIP